MFKVVLIFVLSFIYLMAEDCIECHNIEKFDEVNHNFTCKECHVKKENYKNFNHDTDLVLHPDSIENVDMFCGSCHKKDIEGLHSSSHMSLKNEINKTRKMWGIKNSNVDLQSIPTPHGDINNPEDLVDDFLRRKCLKCHIGNQGSGEAGMYRGKGCMSCHMEYSSDGKYKGSDLTTKDKKPYAKIHKLNSRPPMSACLSCHNKNFVGTDYLGLFPKDFDKSYRAPITKEGKYPRKMYGTSYHHLKEDVHYQAGLECVDCHKKDNIMNSSHINSTVLCMDCHKNISKIEAHESYHDNLSCTTCHASWQMSNYELSVFRDDIADYDKWKNLMNQEDAYLESFLKKAIKSKKKPKPFMPDWVNKTMKDGIWYTGWRFRRWEHLLLGNDIDGKVKILRPMYQYRISYRDKNATVVLNDVNVLNNDKIEGFSPYSPHTISKNAKSCESCHENSLLLKPVKNSGTVLDLLSGKVVDGTPLTKDQLIKLQSKKYKRIRLKMLF